MFDLTDKTALVTGATGGIGAAIARAFHKQGATVAVSGRQVDKLEALAAELGDRCVVVPCDLATSARRSRSSSTMPCQGWAAVSTSSSTTPASPRTTCSW